MTIETSGKMRAGRRTLLKGMAAGMAIPAITLGARRANAASLIKIGYVSPQTGPLAAFGAADSFVIGAVQEVFAQKGLNIQILVRDSQSSSNRAATVANDLINENISLMLVASTPETTNPVSDQCELAQIPCLSTVAPWQPWYFNRGGTAAQGFQYTYHFFWGLEDVIASFTSMWSQLPTNKIVGGLFPNDSDGTAWSNPKRGFPPALAKAGYALHDPGRFQDGSSDFTAQITAFKAANAQILTGNMIPPDWTTFWTQASQQGYKPLIASVGKALLFPASVNALGPLANNLSTEVWWSPNHPFKSSLTGQSSGALAAAYTAKTGKQWTQPIGFAHALLELAADIVARASDPTDPNAVLAALVATNLNTVVGPISWGHGPVKNVAKTPMCGGQWRATPGGPFKYDLVITENSLAPNIPVASTMQAIG